MRPLLRLFSDLRRQILIHRRGLAALCAAGAVLVTLQTLRPAAPITVELWTAARDVPAGTRLTRDDLGRTAYPPDLAPGEAVPDLDRLVGRTLVVPLERGQPVSARHLLGRNALVGYPGRAAIAVRLPDADVATLLRPGDRVDLWSTDARNPGPAALVVDDAAVLAASEPESGGLTSAGAASGALVLLAVPNDEIATVAAATATGFLSVAWNR